MDELLGRFVAALEANDGAALEALRVDETEYRKIIMPGSVKPGQPPQKLSPAADQYFWESLDTKSRYGGRALLAGYRGRNCETAFAGGSGSRDYLSASGRGSRFRRQGNPKRRWQGDGD